MTTTLDRKAPGVNGDKEHGALARWRPWNERSTELAVHLEKHWVVRTDVFGRYYRDPDGSVRPKTERNTPLTQNVLLRHCRAQRTEEVIGAHTTVWMPVDGAPGGGVSSCRQAQADIDWHGDGAAPEANGEAAIVWHDRLANLGFRPLLIDSNGRGGYRLVVIFDEPITARHARQLMRWVTRDWRELGLAECPETFPKQDEINPPGSESGSFGNWLRLPGRHHKRDHWSCVYSDGEWLEGEDAVAAILDYAGDSPQLIPAEAIRFDPEPRATGDAGPTARTDEQLEGDAAIAREALARLGPGVKDERGREYGADYDHWLRVGMACHDLGDVGLGLWLDWSSQWADRFDPEVCVYKWGTFRREGERRTRLGTLLKYAQGTGWKVPSGPKSTMRGGAGGKKERGEKPASDYILGRGDRALSCASNTRTWLEENRPQGWARYDRFRRVVLVGGEPLTDQHIIDLTLEVEELLQTPWCQDHTRAALLHLAHRDQFSSLVEYLDSLRWDGDGRVGDFFSDHYGCDKTTYHVEVARVLFLSAVARAYQPGCKVDTVPVLIGPQGCGKSAGIAALCPHDDWFCDDIGNDMFAGKAGEGLQAKWLIELAELARVNRATVEVVKAFISRRVDHYRPPYGRTPQDFPRTCIFVATTNEDQPLQDAENRRYLPVRVGDASVPMIGAARDQLWAEAVRRYKDGESWWTTSSQLVQETRDQVETARAADAWEGLLADRLRSLERTTVAEAAGLLGISIDRIGKSEQIRIGNALKKLGFKRDREPNPPRAWYYMRSSVPT